jgi:hypothetical protein
MICKSAMEGADRMLKEREYYMNKDYKIESRFKCKGDEPALLPVNVMSLRGKKWRKLKKKIKK